jgi:O-antigen/teichoic acid export membrane protein
MTSGLIQKKDPTEIQYSTVFYINIGISILLMLLMILSSGAIANYYAIPEVGSIAKFVSLTFVINALNGVQQAQLTKALANKVKTIATLISSIVSGVLGIFLAYHGYGVWSLVYSSLLGSIVNTIYVWLNSTWRPKAMFDFNEVKPLLNFGSKMFASGIIDTVYTKLDVLIIGKLFPPATLGFYYRAVSFNQLVIRYTSGSLQGVFFPVISHLQFDKEAQIKVVKKSLHILSFLTFLLLGLLYLNAKELIVLLFSEKWLVSVEYFKIMVFYGYAYPVSVILVNVISGNGHSGKFLKLEVWKKVIGFLAMAIGFYFGIKGFLWGSVLSSFLAVVLNMWYVQKIIQWNWLEQLKILLPYTIASVLVVLIVLFFNKFAHFNILVTLLLNSTFFLIFYTIFNYLIKSAGYLYTMNLIKQGIGKISLRFT